MGGRGSSSGVSIKDKKYGSEYKSLLTYGNIKFVVTKAGNTTAPLETMTRNRIYVTLDISGNPKYITYYDRENKRCKQIDMDKPHWGISPHVHHGYNHNENDTSKGFTHLTPKEKAMVERVERAWGEKRNVVWNRWKRRQQSN